MTFRHQRVYDPEQKQLVHLRPLLADEPELGELEYLGKDMPAERAQQVAEGVISPVTFETFVSKFGSALVRTAKSRRDVQKKERRRRAHLPSSSSNSRPVQQERQRVCQMRMEQTERDMEFARNLQRKERKRAHQYQMRAEQSARDMEFALKLQRTCSKRPRRKTCKLNFKPLCLIPVSSVRLSHRPIPQRRTPTETVDAAANRNVDNRGKLALLLHERWLQRILHYGKTWEIRGRYTKVCDKIYLARINKIYGETLLRRYAHPSIRPPWMGVSTAEPTPYRRYAHPLRWLSVSTSKRPPPPLVGSIYVYTTTPCCTVDTPTPALVGCIDVDTPTPCVGWAHRRRYAHHLLWLGVSTSIRPTPALVDCT